MVFLLDVSYHVSWQFELYPVDIITGGGKHAKFACVFFFGLYLYAHIFSIVHSNCFGHGHQNAKTKSTIMPIKKSE